MSCLSEQPHDERVSPLSLHSRSLFSQENQEVLQETRMFLGLEFGNPISCKLHCLLLFGFSQAICKIIPCEKLLGTKKAWPSKTFAQPSQLRSPWLPNMSSPVCRQAVCVCFFHPVGGGQQSTLGSTEAWGLRTKLSVGNTTNT